MFGKKLFCVIILSLTICFSVMIRTICADVVFLRSTSLCHMHINSIPVQSAILYGHPEDLFSVIEKKDWIYTHSCEYIFAMFSVPQFTITDQSISIIKSNKVPDKMLSGLSGYVGKQFNDEEVFKKFLKDQFGADLSENSLFIVTDSSKTHKPTEQEYILQTNVEPLTKDNVLSKLEKGQLHIEIDDPKEFLKVYRGEKKPPEPSTKTPRVGVQKTEMKIELECKINDDICFSPDNTAKFSAECEANGISVSIESTGKFTISAGTESASISLEFGR